MVSEGFKVSKRNYLNHEITEFYNKESRETIYFSFIKNQMIASFTHTILEASIDEYLEPIKAKDATKTTVVTSKTVNAKNETAFNEATLFNILEIFPPDLTAKSYIKKRNNGSIDFSVELKDGVLNVKYKAYYPNGTLKISGKYKKGKQSVTWRAYNENEDLIVKKRF